MKEKRKARAKGRESQRRKVTILTQPKNGCKKASNRVEERKGNQDRKSVHIRTTFMKNKPKAAASKIKSEKNKAEKVCTFAPRSSRSDKKERKKNFKKV